MNSDDMLLISMGINIGLIWINHNLSRKLDLLGDFTARTMVVMKALAEGKIKLRIHNDTIRIIDLKEQFDGNQTSE